MSKCLGVESRNASNEKAQPPIVSVLISQMHNLLCWAFSPHLTRELWANRDRVDNLLLEQRRRNTLGLFSFLGLLAISANLSRDFPATSSGRVDDIIPVVLDVVLCVTFVLITSLLRFLPVHRRTVFNRLQLLFCAETSSYALIVLICRGPFDVDLLGPSIVICAFISMDVQLNMVAWSVGVMNGGATLICLAHSQMYWTKHRGGKLSNPVGAAVLFLGSIALAVDVVRWRETVYGNIREKAEHQEVLYSEEQETMRYLFHELRNPLQVIAGVLQDDAVHDVAYRSEQAFLLLREAQYSVMSMGQLMADVQRISSLRSRGHEMRLGYIEVVPIIQQCTSIAHDMINTKGVHLLMDLEGISGEAALCNEAALRGIVCHGLSNAIRHCAQQVTIRGVLDGGRMNIRIEDDGLGMSAESIESAFEMFTCNKAAGTHRRGGGSGLGLAESRLLADILHATISLESEGSSGSRGTALILSLLHKKVDRFDSSNLEEEKQRRVLFDDEHLPNIAGQRKSQVDLDSIPLSICGPEAELQVHNWNVKFASQLSHFVGRRTDSSKMSRMTNVNNIVNSSMRGGDGGSSNAGYTTVRNREGAQVLAKSSQNASTDSLSLVNNIRVGSICAGTASSPFSNYNCKNNLARNSTQDLHDSSVAARSIVTLTPSTSSGSLPQQTQSDPSSGPHRNNCATVMPTTTKTKSLNAVGASDAGDGEQLPQHHHSRVYSGLARKIAETSARAGSPQILSVSVIPPLFATQSDLTASELSPSISGDAKLPVRSNHTNGISSTQLLVNSRQQRRPLTISNSATFLSFTPSPPAALPESSLPNDIASRTESSSSCGIPRTDSGQGGGSAKKAESAREVRQPRHAEAKANPSMHAGLGAVDGTDTTIRNNDNNATTALTQTLVAGNVGIGTLESNPLNSRKRPLRILFVDDVPANRIIGQRIVSQAAAVIGVKVSIELASNGKEAVSAFEKAHTAESHDDSTIGFKLIFMDITMPIMDGWEAARRIRALAESGGGGSITQLSCGSSNNNNNPLFARVPSQMSMNNAPRVPLICAVTGNTLAEDVRKCYDCGMDVVILKPYSMEQVQRVLESAVESFM